MAIVECCEFTSPIVLGDTVSVITINAGSGDTVTDITIYAEGCGDGTNNCSYQDIYSGVACGPPGSGCTVPGTDIYCDLTEGGTLPNAMVTDTIYEITQIPAGHSLIIDAVERTVRLMQTGTNNQIGGLETLEFTGLFEWITSSGGGCINVCIDGSEAATNPDTTVLIETVDREL